MTEDRTSSGKLSIGNRRKEKKQNQEKTEKKREKI